MPPKHVHLGAKSPWESAVTWGCCLKEHAFTHLMGVGLSVNRWERRLVPPTHKYFYWTTSMQGYNSAPCCVVYLYKGSSIWYTWTRMCTPFTLLLLIFNIIYKISTGIQTSRKGGDGGRRSACESLWAMPKAGSWNSNKTMTLWRTARSCQESRQDISCMSMP